MKDYSSAVKDFKKARDRAALDQLLASLTGRSTELLSYEEVRRKVRASGVISRSVQDVRLSDIVGSVNRYNDFTRRFLPKLDSDESRWANVLKATMDSPGLPPVELYQIGDAYFVNDGHHRVSVARQLGAETIQAYVTEIRSKVPVDPMVQPDDLIIRAEYADFLQITGLDRLVPEVDFIISRAGKYQELLEHIEVHRYYMGLEWNREISFDDAVIHWFETVYWPVIHIIRELGIVQRFPDRSETDLYLWISKYKAEKEDQLGWQVRDSAAAVDLVEHYSSEQSSIFGRIGQQILELVLPDNLEPTPDTGQWRREQQADQQSECLFSDILVPLSGDEISWNALEQAIDLSKRECGRIKGLYILQEGEEIDDQAIKDIQDRFEWRANEMGVPFNFTVDRGPVAATIIARARWVDLVVFNLAHPPQAEPAARLASGVRKLINKCTRPLLMVPGKNQAISKALLAFDGSPKSREALFIATYISGRWQVPLVVASITEKGDDDDEVILEAKDYLESSGVEASFIGSSDSADEDLLNICKTYECNLLIIGGYGSSPVVGVFKDSVVDSILRHSPFLTLICR